MSRTEWREGDRTRVVELNSIGAGRWRVRVDDAEFEVAAEVAEDGRMRIVADGAVHVAEVTAAGGRRFVRLGSLDFVLEREASGRRRAGSTHHGGLEAPMPGAITRVLVSPGDAVSRGQALVAIEAMKMEHLVRSPRAGRVKTVRAGVGDRVAPGTALIELEEPESTADTPAEPPPGR